MNPKIFDNPPQILWEIKHTVKHTHTHRLHDACATWQIKFPPAFHKHRLCVLDTSAEVRYKTVFPSVAIITMPSASEILGNPNQDYFITSRKYPTSQRWMEVPDLKHKTSASPRILGARAAQPGVGRRNRLLFPPASLLPLRSDLRAPVRKICKAAKLGNSAGANQSDLAL